ncbi:MAG: hypothetical protein MPI93_04110 [Nitrosopumilus sp.]|nr:hypothetical protein [Nitrosopumilus sp.]
MDGHWAVSVHPSPDAYSDPALMADSDESSAAGRWTFIEGIRGRIVEPVTDRINRIVIRLMLDLDEAGWLRARPAGSRKYRMILSRLGNTNPMMDAIRSIEEDPDTRDEFRKASSKWLDESVWTDIVLHLLIYRIIQLYEFVTKILVDSIDEEKLADLRRPSLVSIVDLFSKDVECGEFRNLLNNDLRNALAHDDYWIFGVPARLVYDEAPAGIALRDLDHEYECLREIVSTLADWYDERTKQEQWPDSE